MTPPGVLHFEKSFFDLQVKFAHRVAQLSAMPMAGALLDYTNLFVRFGLGRAFDAAHPVWQDFLAGLPTCTAQGTPAAVQDWAWRFYQHRQPHGVPAAMAASVGCFSYAFAGDGCIRLHFDPTADASGQSPLASARRGQRQEELRALLALVRQNEAPGVRVLGTSWLYQIEAYRRLFPAAYLATAVPVQRYRNLPLWGQFLDRHGAVRPAMAEPFLQRLAQVTGMDGIAACFAYQPRAMDAPVEVFRDQHGMVAGTLRGSTTTA